MKSHSPRILIIRAGAIGDTLMTTPLVRALRRRFPKAHLGFLCSRAAADTLSSNPHLDRVIPLSYRHLPIWTSLEKWRICRQLRQLEWDWALTLESHPDFLELARRSGARRLAAYGDPEDRRLAGFERLHFDPKKHSIENHLGAMRLFGSGADGSPQVAPDLDRLDMDFCYPPGLDLAIRDRLERAGVAADDLVVAIHAGWGGRGVRERSLEDTRLRSWPPRRFAAVARWLVEEAGARVILTGAAADRTVTRFIARESQVLCLDLSGELSLLELAALIRRLTAYLTVDSAPAHMAAALGTPLVTLWGPGIFEQTRPLGRGLVRILYKKVPCAPCYGTPLMRTCRDNICMKEIGEAEVKEALREVLAASRAGPGTDAPRPIPART